MAIKTDSTTDTSSSKTSTAGAQAQGQASTADVTNPFAAFASFDPMAMWTNGQAQFSKLMTDALGRVSSFGDQFVAFEGQMVERAQGAVTTWAKLTQDAIAYGAQLSSEARKTSLETAKKFGIGA
jgi:hypothetical protein